MMGDPLNKDEMPERCPTCNLNWQYHGPAKVYGAEMVRCIECKDTFALSTTPAPDGLAVVGWRGGKDDGSRKYTEIKRVAEIWADQNLTVIPLVRADQAQSALAAVRVEIEHWRGEARRLLKSGQEALDAAETAEAEVKRLTEALEQISKDEVHTAFGTKPTRGAQIARATLNNREKVNG